jgi:hypothetical protein
LQHEVCTKSCTACSDVLWNMWRCPPWALESADVACIGVQQCTYSPQPLENPYWHSQLLLGFARNLKNALPVLYLVLGIQHSSVCPEDHWPEVTLQPSEQQSLAHGHCQPKPLCRFRPFMPARSISQPDVCSQQSFGSVRACSAVEGHAMPSHLLLGPV